MLTETNLKELLGFKSENQVLSLYLNTDPTQGNSDVYRSNLRGMLKSVELPADVEAAENYFSRDFDWSGRGVALFSCAPDDFLRTYPIAIPVRNQVVVGTQPYVKPLASLLDYYGGYGVILIDKQGARLFSFHLGEVKEQEGFLGEGVKHTKRGGASTKPGNRGGISGQTRYEEELADRNMRDVVDLASHFFSANNVRRVLIGGTDENIALLRNQLPKSWLSLVIGTFPMSMTAHKGDVLEKAMHVGQQVEFQQEEQLLNRVVTGTAKEQKGVLDLDGTLGAVHDGKIQTLVIQDGYRAPGFRCLGCGFLTSQEQAECPFCGSKFENIPDAVEMAIHQVMNTGGEVDVLQHPHNVKGFDSIGAILRY